MLSGSVCFITICKFVSAIKTVIYFIYTYIEYCAEPVCCFTWSTDQFNVVPFAFWTLNCLLTVIFRFLENLISTANILFSNKQFYSAKRICPKWIYRKRVLVLQPALNILTLQLSH